MRVHAFSFLCATVAVGCFGPEYGNPSFACGEGGSCPSGYECRIDGFCHQIGSVSTPDAPRPADGASDGMGSDGPAIDAREVAANDMCPAPTASSLVEGSAVAGSLSGTQHDVTPSCLSGAGADAFYQMVLDADHQVSLQLDSFAALGLSVWSSDCATEIACGGDGAGGETLSVDSLPAGTYQVGIHAETGAAGDFSLSYTTGDPVVRPENDGCGGTVPTLEDGVVLTGQNAANALDDSSGSCANGPDVVYSFTISGGADRRAVLTVDNATFDPALHLEAACGTTALACAQTGTDGHDVLDAFQLAPGTYTVWVEVASGTPGTFDLGLELSTAIPPPPNDTCDAPDVLTLGASRSGTTLGALDDVDLACIVDGPDAVHAFSLPSTSAVLVTVSPSSPWPAAFDVRDGASCASGPALACAPGGFADFPRYFNRKSMAMGTYDVVVDGVGGAAGDYGIRVDTRAPDATFGYWVVEGTRTFTSIAGAPGAVSLDIQTRDTAPPYLDGPDEGEYPVDLPFAFPYFGTPVTRVYADVNRFLSLAAVNGASAYDNDCPWDGLTDPVGIIALLWDDGWAVVGSQIWTRVEGVAPNRRVVIEFNGLDYLHCNPCVIVGARSTEQAILYENGDIELHYGPRSGPAMQSGCNQHQLGCSATIGIDAAGALPVDVDAYTCGTTLATANKVVRFIYPQ